jgi:Zn ribbon nucleic-acid-binding protein
MDIVMEREKRLASVEPEVAPANCPACGSCDTALGGRDDMRWIECRRCEHDGPEAKTKDEAMALWNRAVAGDAPQIPPPPRCRHGIEAIHCVACDLPVRRTRAPQIPPPPIPADREGRRKWNDAFVRAQGAIPCWTTFEDGFHGVDPAPDGKGTWVSAEDFCTVVARAEAALAAERQRTLELAAVLKKSKSLASIGYRIGEADMRGHDRVGARYGKQQDDLIAEIDAALSHPTQAATRPASTGEPK